MTVMLYTRRNNWLLQDVTVRLRHSRVHPSDCAECEAKEAHIDRIEWWLQLSGELTDEQRTRLLEIAERCPVHRTMV